MIVRPVKTARSLQILHEIGQIPLTSVQGKNLSCKNVLIGLTLPRDVSREKRQKEWTEDLGARKMEAFQLNAIKSKKYKM